MQVWWDPRNQCYDINGCDLQLAKNLKRSARMLQPYKAVDIAAQYEFKTFQCKAGHDGVVIKNA